MQIFKTAVNNAKTHDIIYALCMAAPAAIKQAKQFNLPEVIGLSGANLQDDAILTGRWIRNNVKYKIDSFENQNIQLPSALLKSGTGDCKSFSLLFLAIMEAAGYNGGFRFAAYRGNNFTHVYNFFVNKNNIYTFDSCIKDLKEVKSYTRIKDMRVNYLAGTPMLIDETTGIERIPKPIDLIQDDRVLSINGIGKKKKGLPKIKKLVKKGFKTFKTVSLAAPRGSFILLTNINFRGIANRLQKLKDISETKYAEFWTKLGGDIDKLNKAVDKGKKKKALFGKKKGLEGLEEEIYIGVEPVSDTVIAAAITSATGIIVALTQILKKNKVPKSPGEPEIDEGFDPNTPLSPDAEPGEPVIPNDPASEGAASYIKKGIDLIEGVSNLIPKVKVKGKPKGRPAAPSRGESEADTDKTPEASTGFTPSPLLIGGGIAAIAAIYFLTKKKK